MTITPEPIYPAGAETRAIEFQGWEWRVPQLVESLVHRCRTRASQHRLFSALVCVDVFFIAIHVWLAARGQLFDRFDLGADSGLPEKVQYLKWTASAAACAYLLYRSRAALYLSWALLFVYFALDDANRIHERLGGALASAFDIGPAFALRGQDFGELAVSLMAGTVLLGFMAAAFARAGPSDGARRFTLALLPWLSALVFFGVVVDLLHIQVGFLGWSTLWIILEVVEDGGEMIAGSALAALSVRQVMAGARAG